jgi:hydrogenase/urease accessory protein HupE
MIPDGQAENRPESPDAQRTRRRARWLLVSGMSALSLNVLGSSPAAHVGGSTGYAAIGISGNTVRYGLSLSPSATPAPVAEELALAAAGNAPSRETVLGYVRAKVTLVAQGERCEPVAGFVEPARPEVETVTLVMDFACPARVRSLRVRDDLVDVLGLDHHTLARVEWGETTRQLAFGAETREAQVELQAMPSATAGLGTFFVLGLHHILSGYDHLLFLLALMLRGGGILSLLGIVTAFTLAHSVTLTLAGLGLVSLPERLVETAIAASIVWVSLDNLVAARPPSHRWRVSFAFGLVHGLGFAAALGPLELSRWGLVGALVAFNTGVEAGQAAVVALAVPGLAWLRRRSWEPLAVRVASVGLVVAGLAWLIERVRA